MKYLIFNQKANAVSRTANIATAQGCGQNENDITTAWFGVIEHPANIPQAALAIPDGEESKLTAQERNLLKDHEFMELQGWFDNSNNGI